MSIYFLVSIYLSTNIYACLYGLMFMFSKCTAIDFLKFVISMMFTTFIKYSISLACHMASPLLPLSLGGFKLMTILLFIPPSFQGEKYELKN